MKTIKSIKVEMFEDIQASRILIGDLVFLNNMETSPADLLILDCSE